MTIEEILAALQAIIDAAVDDSGAERPLTEEEAARYEELEGKLKAVQRSEQIKARNTAYNTVQRSDLHVATGADTRKDDTLARAFNAYMRTGVVNADLVELRAQSEGTGSEGGYLVPDEFRNKIVDRMKAFGGIANVAETITTSTGAPLSWPTLDDTANVGEIVEEGGTFSSGADLVFGQANLGAYRYMAGGGSATPLRVSVELAQDSAFDIEALVSRKLGERIARVQATHLVTGTGVGQPQGIVQGLTGVEISTALSYDDLIDIIHTVDPAYRDSGCRWAFNDATLAHIKKMQDAAGDPLWRNANADMATDAGGGTLLGYPVTIDQAFGDIVLTNGADDIWGVFGNLSEGYVIRRVRDVTVVVNPWTRAANGQIEYTAWARMDAAQQNTNAYTAIAGHTT